MGTLGYIPPEIMQTGMATPSSDVFSFGVLLLEVACGRKPVDVTMDEKRVLLVEWVSNLCAQGRLLDAADPKLGNEYNSGEMEKVLIMGFFTPMSRQRRGREYGKCVKYCTVKLRSLTSRRLQLT